MCTKIYVQFVGNIVSLHTGPVDIWMENMPYLEGNENGKRQSDFDTLFTID